MNEAETRAELIDPALKAAGWNVVEGSRIWRDVITLGRLQGAGTRGKQEIADHVLTYRNHKLAVIEAKRRDLPDTEGVAQSKTYAAKLQARPLFPRMASTSIRSTCRPARKITCHAIQAPRSIGTLSLPSKTFGATASRKFPSRTKAARNRGAIISTTPSPTRSRPSPKAKTAFFSRSQRVPAKLSPPFRLRGSSFKALNLSREPARHPRILFLADRNILTDQAYNAFSAFREDALVRIRPDEIAKKGRAPKNMATCFSRSSKLL